MPPRTPTLIQLLGLAVTLGAVTLFSHFTLQQLNGLSRLGTDIVERNRRDSLQLIRIQDDLAQLGLALRDMSEGAQPYPLSAYRPQLERLKEDLQNALEVEATLRPQTRTESQQKMLEAAFSRFWSEAGLIWPLAQAGREREAVVRIRTRIESERASMATFVSRLLVQNNEAEAAAVTEIERIHTRVRQNLWALLAAAVAAITLTGALVIWHDRRVFAQVSRLSERRRELAGKVIRVQEDVFRTLAREVHDEFGQVLTAIGTMVRRVEKRLPDGSAERADLGEIREIANQTLERARSMTQMLHPPVLDDYGLEKSIEWYLGQFQKQTGVQVRYEKIGASEGIAEGVAIHVYRILQESLNNVVKHAGVLDAGVTVEYVRDWMRLEVEDHGVGLPARPRESGMGMIGMRERAELLGGRIEFTRGPNGGTLVKLEVPLTSGGERV